MLGSYVGLSSITFIPKNNANKILMVKPMYLSNLPSNSTNGYIIRVNTTKMKSIIWRGKENIKLDSDVSTLVDNRINIGVNINNPYHLFFFI